MNGIVRTGQFSIPVMIGSVNSITTPRPQSLGGTTYQLVGWSDGRPRTHFTTEPKKPTTVTATFGPT